MLLCSAWCAAGAVTGDCTVYSVQGVSVPWRVYNYTLYCTACTPPAPALSLNWLRGEQLLTTTQCLDLVIFTHLHFASNKQFKLVRKIIIVLSV